MEVAYKIDGVRLLDRSGSIVTRNDKVPPGLECFLSAVAKEKIRAYGDCEVYRHGKNFHFISGNLNSHMEAGDELAYEIGVDDVYPLDFDKVGEKHAYDSRLFKCKVQNPTPELIQQYLEDALSQGYEGLVLRTADRWYRVKPEYTADVYVTGWFEQLDVKKRPKGQLGGFTTKYGRVTAFTDADRVSMWDNPEQYVGQMITVQYRELYETGSFRYAVKFLHLRHDKDEEAFDTKAN